MTDDKTDSAPAPESPEADARLERLLDAFAAKLLQGERPSVSDILKEAPELATQIRKLFPAIRLLGGNSESVEGGTLLSSTSPLPGGSDRLGGYRLVREVGRGGMGVVYEAMDEALGRKVALKILPFHAHTNQASIERFRREAMAAASLQHRGIVPIIGIGEDRGVHFYAMQYIEGESLERVIRDLRRLQSMTGSGLGADERSARALSLAAALLRDSFPSSSPESPRKTSDATRTRAEPTLATWDETRDLGSGPRMEAGAGVGGPAGGIPAGDPAPYFRSVARLLRDAAEAIGYANGRGVLHRDIKPSNLMLDLSGHVWIADFGLAAIEGQDRLTNPGDILGTLRYMAPERLEGRCDSRSEVYSLGLTLYELLTHQPAFEEDDRASRFKALMAGLRRGPREIDSRIPETLDRIVLRAAHPAPERRYESALALAGDLNAFLDGRAISTPAAATRRIVPARKKLTLAVAALGFILAASATWFIWGIHRPRFPQHFVVADFDADGRADILTGNAVSSSVTLLGNERNGGFGVRRHLRVEPRPYAVMVMDFDGDEAPDLLTSSYDARAISILRNDGRGGLALSSTVPIEAQPNFAAVLGKSATHALRVAVAAEARALYLLDVDSNGRAIRAGTVELAVPAKIMTAADFDGDARLDLALAHGRDESGVTVVRSLPDGTLGPPVRYGARGDGDPRSETTIDSSWGLCTADWNRDERVDLAVAAFRTNGFHVLLGTADGGFEAPRAVMLPGAVMSLVPADFDGDGMLDLAGAGDEATYVCLLRGRGDGTFDQPVQLPSLGQGASWIETADLDLDGAADFAVTHVGSNDLAVYLNDGKGGFERCSRIGLTSWSQWLRNPAP